MAISRNTLIFGAIGLLILAAVWYVTFGAPDSSAIISADAAPATAAELTFLNLTARIDPVEFDTSILEDSRFQALRDIRTAIVPEVAGRPNPFMPLSGTTR